MNIMVERLKGKALLTKLCGELNTAWPLSPQGMRNEVSVTRK